MVLKFASNNVRLVVQYIERFARGKYFRDKAKFIISSFLLILSRVQTNHQDGPVPFMSLKLSKGEMFTEPGNQYT